MPSYYWTFNEMNDGKWYYRCEDDGHVLCAIVSWDSAAHQWEAFYCFNYNGAPTSHHSLASDAKDSVETVVNAGGA
jgi:hypothetical protein